MSGAERDALLNAARTMAGEVQSGDVQGLRTNTIPAVAADFGGIAASVSSLKPLVQPAAITIDDLYILDASTEPAGTPRTDFFCGMPTVVINFTNLPPATYALAIVHATGVPEPQQVSLILSKTAANHWMLAGFFSKPMMEAGHTGLWYWESAREYVQKKMNLDAWLYYQTAENLLEPVPFLSSPNLEKLQHEAEPVRPDGLPGTRPMVLQVGGSAYQVSGLDVTAALGALDLEVHYAPDSAQAAQLREPVAARKQVIDVMTALLAAHPELRTAFGGMWVHAEEGDTSLYALDLTMAEIAGAAQAPLK